MAETTFGIAYDGPALASGRMDVRDLAPALIGLSDLFSLSSGILYPELPPVAIKVEATREGSFFVHLLIEAEKTWDQFVQMFSSAEATALENLRDTLLVTGGGLFWLIRTLKGRHVERVERSPEPGKVRLVLDDKTTLEVPNDTWTLHRSIEIRKHTREVVSPLAREGIEVVRLTIDDKSEPVVVGKDDLSAYAINDDAGDQEQLLRQEQQLYVELISVAFREGNKWRLGLGEYTFWATVRDFDFLDRIERGEEAFRKGDVLRCRIQVTQNRDADGLHTEYEVIEVLEHRPRPPHHQLDLESPAD